MTTIHRLRRRRDALVRPLTDTQDGVASRRQLLALGLTRWDIAAELRAGRWRQHHRQTICIHTGPLGDRARLWHAVIEAGTRAVLDGTGSLLAAGLKGFEADHVRVSVPRGAKILSSPAHSFVRRDGSGHRTSSAAASRASAPPSPRSERACGPRPTARRHCS